MNWPYHFVDLTKEQVHARRVLLDRYGIYSQLSAFVPVIAFQLYRLSLWVYSERLRTKVAYAAVPSSPDRKKERTSSLGVVRAKWRSVVWWLGGEVAPKLGLGLRGQWIATSCWTVWLVFLGVHRTGDDYLHLTKRLGEVAVAQFPLHYMLSMKSRYSPLALAFNASHEELNPWHRLNAKAIYALLLCHAALYLNYFIQIGVLQKRIKNLDVIIGITAISLLTILMSTALQPIRQWSYRVFFIIHLVLGIILLPLLFFHAHHLRIYVTEALVLFLVDIVLRKLDTITSFATIASIENTKLVKVKIPVTSEKLHRFHAAPGQHVYLSIPPSSTPAGTSFPSIHDLLHNPFTVAEVSDTDITLVLRALNGPTSKALSALTKLTKAKPPINIEGPLGGSQHFPNLIANYDRILLVAGGVGSTFILPFYKALRAQLESESLAADRLKLVWSMRSAAEANWAMESKASKSEIEEDENIQIFLTKSTLKTVDKDDEAEEGPADGSVEMEELLPQGQVEEEGSLKINGGKERPDLKSIVDGVFKLGTGEKVAIMVCGPKGMARELRGYVGEWVGKGREVWFHDEGFGL